MSRSRRALAEDCVRTASVFRKVVNKDDSSATRRYGIAAISRCLVWLAAGGAVALSGGFTTAVMKSSQRRVRIAELKVRETSAPARAKAPRFEVLFPGAGYADRGGSRWVRSLQRRLTRAGDRPGPIDGLYGPLTEEAVIDFQAANGLEVDGIAGPQTLSALRQPQPLLYLGAGYGAAGGSAAVRSLQRTLITAGYRPGPVDGLYGPRTEHAVMRFQAAHHLRIDGIAGRQTFAALRAKRSHALGARRSAKPAAHRPSAHSRTAALRVTAPRRKVPRSSVYDFSLVLAAGLGAALLLLALAALVALLRRHWDRRSTWARDKSTPVARESTPAPVPESTLVPVRESTPAPVSESTLAPDQSTLAPGHSTSAPAPSAPRPRSTSRSGEIAFERAAALEARGDLEGAAAAYLQADRVGHGRAAYRLGILLEEQGELTGAEGAYRRAAQRGDSNGALSLASLLEEHGAVQQAIIAYERAAQLGNAKAAAHLGALLKRREGSDRAKVAPRSAGTLEDSSAVPRGPKPGAIANNGTQSQVHTSRRD